ncbi:MAG: YfcE family phosphodiesterase [Treponema sp.]|jgi:putative phosphoesterase|nr:YfcE family phosphodiesterase [Treponema sp.]
MPAPNILVISDTHGRIQALQKVLDWAGERRFDTAIFLGDGAEDLSRVSGDSGMPWLIIRGNGDADLSLPLKASLVFAGHSFFLTHGHLYALSDGFGPLAAEAGDQGAEAALFGHTHLPFLGREDGVLLVNPGSLGQPRGLRGRVPIGPSFATIACPSGEDLQIRFWSLGGNGRINGLDIR